MSGSGAPGSYVTLKKGLKATTSKFMNVSTKQKSSMPPLNTERNVGEKNDGRFTQGMVFKGKLIGVLEVEEARGDKMCQDALAELKTAVRAAGEHKQRISIMVAMDGIRLRDERTGDCLYHHPVHKISFIAQDVNDSRAFGYIYGSPDAGHKFFGIKTEKAACQVATAMRDLFHIVYEMKKKEIEKAKAQLKDGKEAEELKDSSYSGLFGANGEAEIVSSSLTLGAGGPLADLLDLQNELSSLQKGLNEISKRAAQSQPSTSREELSASADPFGDTFNPTSEVASLPSRTYSTSSSIPAPLAPPPSRSRHDQKLEKDEFGKFPVDFKNINHSRDETDRFKSSSARSSLSRRKSSDFDEGKFIDREEWEKNEFGGSGDVFTDLDPLGTGKIKPFVDKKDFFTEIRKANTRKVMREMSEDVQMVSSPRIQPGTIPAEVSALVASSSLYTAPNPPITSTRQPISQPTPLHGSVPSYSDSFGHNFEERCRSVSRERLDGFANFSVFSDSPRSQRSDFSSNFEDTPNSSGSLAVALPPESFRDSPPPFSPPPPPRSISNSPSPQMPRRHVSPVIQNRFLKQRTFSTSPVSPKTLPRGHKFARQLSCDDWEDQFQTNGFSELSGYQGRVSPRPRPRSSLSKVSCSTLPLKSPRSRYSDRMHTSSPSFDRRSSQHEDAPEPPPRPAPVEPPPLPPKRLPSHVTYKPPPRPPPSGEQQHYIYINEYDSSPDPSVTSPPIPIPARKPKYSDSLPSRRKDDFYFPRASQSPTREISSKGLKGSSSSLCSTPGRSTSRSGSHNVDLANTSLDQLASNLNIPVEQLAKMTVVELASCLAQQQLKEESKSGDEAESIPMTTETTWSDSKWSQNFDDDTFAKFDSEFPKSPVETPSFKIQVDKKFPVVAPVSEDRYAVFRELTMTSKQKSVFDENFLTPQNSMEDEVSEVSSGTFKVNFNEDLYPDSIEQKSSISDEMEVAEINRNKSWDNPERIDHECVTVFRSPDISEYENFEPNFQCKFEDDFSTAEYSERSDTPVNYNSQFENIPIPSEAFSDNFSKDSLFNNQLSKPESIKDSAKTSPFEDNFSEIKVTDHVELSYPEKYRSRRRHSKSKYDSEKSRKGRKKSLEAYRSSEKSVSPFDDDFAQRTDKYEVLRELDNDKDTSFDGEVSASNQDLSFEDSWQKPRTEDQKSVGSFNSVNEERQSPIDQSHSSRKMSDEQELRSRISSEFRSSFSEPLTPGVKVPASPRASIGSEDSLDVRQSPFDDNFSIEVRQENVERHETFFNERKQDNFLPESRQDISFLSELKQDNNFMSQMRHDSFLSEEQHIPGDETIDTKEDKSEPDSKSGFADFENAFQPKKSPEEEIFPDVETEFKVSARYSHKDRNFFKRDSDPFADDFFMQDSDSLDFNKCNTKNNV